MGPRHTKHRTFRRAVLIVPLAAAGLWGLLRGDGGAARRVLVIEGPTGSEPMELRELDLGSQATRFESRRAALTPTGSSTPASATSGARTLHGRVVDARGEPVADARIEVARCDARDVTLPPLSELGRRAEIPVIESDSSGEFTCEIDDALGGRFLCSANSPRHRTSPLRRIDVPPKSAAVDLGTFVLEDGYGCELQIVGPGGSYVSGAFVLRSYSADLRPGEPYVPGFGEVLGRTEADGSFHWNGFSDRPVTLLVDALGFEPVEARVRPLPSGGTRAPLRIQLARGLSIAGKILGDESGGSERLLVRARPQRDLHELALHGERGYDIRAYRERRALVTPEGSFEVQGLATGRTYDLSVESVQAGGEAATDCGAARGHALVLIGSSDGSNLFAAGTDGVELRLRSMPTVSFRVVAAESGRAIERFSWSLVQDRRAALPGAHHAVATHPGGKVVDAPLAFLRTVGARLPEEYRISIRAEGRTPAASSAFKLGDFPRIVLGDIAMQPARAVSIEVVGSDGAAPIAGAAVYLFGRSAFGAVDRYRLRGRCVPPEEAEPIEFAATDEEGVAVLTEPRGAGPWTYAAWAPGWITSGFYELGADEAVRGRPRVQLKRAGSALVRVVDPYGTPAGAGIEVHLGSPGREPLRYVPRNCFAPGDVTEPSLELTTNSLGEVLIQGLEPRTYALLATDAKVSYRDSTIGPATWVPAWVEATIRAGEATTIQLVAPLRSSVRGRVTRGGRPLENAGLALVTRTMSSPSEDALRAWTDASGYYSFDDVPLGAWELSVGGETHALPSSYQVEVLEVPAVFDLDLDDATLEGRIVDPMGEPMAGLTVEIRPSVRSILWSLPLGPRLLEPASRSGRGYETTIGQRFLRTDEDGRFVLAGVASEVALKLSVAGAWIRTQVWPIEPLQRDEVRGLGDLEVVPTGDLSVVVQTSDQSRAYLVLRVATDRHLPQSPCISGSRPLQFRHLTAGEVTVSVHRPKQGAQPETLLREARVTIVAGETAELEFSIP